MEEELLKNIKEFLESGEENIKKDLMLRFLIFSRQLLYPAII